MESGSSLSDASPLSEFRISNACVDVRTPVGEKKILQNVNLSARGGEMLAILGPSGAGKTTLLELMTWQLACGRISGDMTLNNKPFTQHVFRNHAYYVEQFDLHWGFLTCHETLEFTAELCMLDAKDKRQEHIERIKQQLGLVECAHTRIGNEYFKGLSGGQKKRLSIGVALLKGVSVLFLDEPTSGLDAAATSSVIGFLQQLAQDNKMIIIATIHQPSTPVFMSFSSALFLANGRVAFHGDPHQVEQYCADIDSMLPAYTNPADHLIQLVNRDFADGDQVDKVVSEWESSSHVVIPHPSLHSGPFPTHLRPTMFAQLCTLLRRQGLISFRDPSLYVGRMAIFLLANTFMTMIYWNARPYRQEFVLPKYFLMGWLGAVPTVFSAVTVFAFNTHFKLMAKEIRGGLVSARSYMLAVLSLEAPCMVVLALAAMVVPVYALAGSNISGLPGTVLILAASLWCFESMAQCFGVIFSGAIPGMLAMLGLWIFSFLFAGTFLKPEFIPWPCREFVDLLPMSYTFRTLHYLQFAGTVWPDAHDSEQQPGFSCDELGPCFGHTGEQVLSTLANFFSSSSQSTLVIDTGVVLLMGVCFKLACFVAILHRTRRPRSGFCRRCVFVRSPPYDEFSVEGSSKVAAV